MCECHCAEMAVHVAKLKEQQAALEERANDLEQRMTTSLTAALDQIDPKKLTLKLDGKVLARVVAAQQKRDERNR